MRRRASVLLVALSWAVGLAVPGAGVDRGGLDRLVGELDFYLRAETADATDDALVRTAARRFVAGRIGRLEAEGAVGAEGWARFHALVDRHVARVRSARPMPAPPSAAPLERAPASTPGRAWPNATGILTGRITDATTGAGVYGAASLYQLGGQKAYITADPWGKYVFYGLEAGTYYVRTHNWEGYVDEAWNDVPCDAGCNPAGVGTPIAVTDGATTEGVDFTLERGGRIAGAAVASGRGVSSLRVEVFDAADRLVTYAYTDANGNFATYGGLASGAYYLRTASAASDPPVVDELYDDVACPFSDCRPSGGTPIPVTSPATTAGIDLVLERGGGLAGTVTRADSSTLLTSSVQIYAGDGRLVGSVHSPDGHWASALTLPSGQYFAVSRNPAGYVDEMWNDVACPGRIPSACGGLGLATPIDVEAGAVTGGVDFALDPGGKIAGTLTDAATSQGIAGTVDVYSEDGRLVAYGYGGAGYTVFQGLPTGRYLAVASAGTYGTAYVDEMYDDVPCFPFCDTAAATTIDVTAGATTTVDFALERGGQVAGTVTDASSGRPVEDAYVDVYSEGGHVVTYGASDGAGRYASFGSGLPAGRYYARARGWTIEGPTYRWPYVEQVYAGVPCHACRPETSGTPIEVAPGAVTSGIDFALDAGGSLSGRVTSAVDGSPIAGTVHAHTLDGHPAKSAATDATGRYTIPGLAPGRYAVRTETAAGFVDRVHDRQWCVGTACDVTTGTPVTVRAGAATPLSFVLSPGARLRGRVADAATGRGLPGVTVSAFKPPAASVASTVTDSRGEYTLGTASGLPAGAYYVRTRNTLGYADEAYDGVPCLGCDPATGTRVSLAAGATTSGVDFALERGGRIAGRLTWAGSGDPLPLSTLSVYDSTGRLVDAPTSGVSGAYCSEPLPPGTYRVGTRLGAAAGFDRLYDGVPFCAGCDPTAGTPVTVAAGATTSGIDIALEGGGRISGRVSDAGTGAPVREAVLHAYDGGGRFERAVRVDALGRYELRGLAPGPHYARAAAGQGYVSQLYPLIPCNGCDPTSGTAVAVAAGGTTGGVDFALDRGGRIGGTVTRAADGRPLDASVDVFDAGGTLAETARTDGAGAYRTTVGLPSGTYYAKATEGSGAYGDELFSDLPCRSCSPTSGTPITVIATALTAGVDFSLDDRGLDFFTLVPCRVVDTRLPSSGGPGLAAGEDRTLSVHSTCGVPLTARALSVNITVTAASAAGHLSLHPGGTAVPGTASITYAAGRTRANNAVVPLSRFGELALHCAQASGTAHVVLDVNGYFE